MGSTEVRGGRAAAAAAGRRQLRRRDQLGMAVRLSGVTESFHAVIQRLIVSFSTAKS